METTLTYLGCSALVLVILTTLYIIEDASGHRVVLPRLRGHLDAVCNAVARKLSISGVLFGKGFLRLLFHYGAHSLLKRILLMLRSWEQKIETLVWNNKRVVKNINTQKSTNRNHLDEIADHKSEVAPSEEKKKELLSQ